MTPRLRRLVAALLIRVYPASWRREYGDELRGLLEARPIGPAIVLDVIAGGARQRLRMTAPATILGVVSALLVTAGVVLTPTGYGQISTALIEPSGITSRIAPMKMYGLRRPQRLIV